MNTSRWIVAVCLVLMCGCALQRTASQTAPTSAQAGATTVVAVAGPPRTTLPEFLGITALSRSVGGLVDRLRNFLGIRFPGLEAKPPVLAITDPANADSPNPAVEGAAAIKADEDAANQKIKAIRYLAGIGCSGCYPGVEDTLIAALDDCTERVRYEAVVAIRGAAGQPCASCKGSSCCSQKMLKKLDELGYGMDNDGCYKEHSPRVRRIARLAMYACGENVEPALPREGPSEEIPPPGQ